MHAQSIFLLGVSTQENFLPTVQGVRYLKCGPQTWEHFKNAES